MCRRSRGRGVDQIGCRQQAWIRSCTRISGPFQADEGTRTLDLLHGKQTLYQLSYIRARPEYSGGLPPPRRPAPCRECRCEPCAVPRCAARREPWRNQGESVPEHRRCSHDRHRVPDPNPVTARTSTSRRASSSAGSPRTGTHRTRSITSGTSSRATGGGRSGSARACSASARSSPSTSGSSSSSRRPSRCSPSTGTALAPGACSQSPLVYLGGYLVASEILRRRELTQPADVLEAAAVAWVGARHLRRSGARSACGPTAHSDLAAASTPA